MRTRLGAACAALLLVGCALLAGAAPAPAVDPRAATGRVAALVRAQYFDAAKAARIADALEAAAAAGAFDRLTDPRDLATELTRRLKPEDGHFTVSWSAASPQPPAARRNDEQAAIREREAADARRGNHGFVEARVLPGGVGYVRLDQFAHFEAAGDPAQKAADAALAFVAGAPSLIIDLRHNGGGSPAMVGYLAAHVLADPARAANRFRSRSGPERAELAPVPPADAARRTAGPLFLLVSGRTASAAEALAYTLQAARRATIVGERTAGAANPGGPRRTADGLSVFISFGKPVNPLTGGNWEGVGVRPDVETPQAEALGVAQILALETEGTALPPGAARVLETLKADARADPALLDGLAGRYGELEIVAVDGRMLLRQGRRPERTLVALARDRFSLAEDPAARFRVERAPSGQAGAIVRELPQGGEQRFERATGQASSRS